MPMYQYKCSRPECRYEFEHIVSLQDFDKADIKCPNCGAEAKRELTGQRTVHSTWKNWRL